MRAKRSWNQGYNTVVIDAMNMCYRMVHTLGALKHGESGTGVIYGFIKNLKELLGKFHGQQAIVVWEGRNGRQRRKEIYPAYKAQRKSELPISKEDFYSQIDNLKEVLYYLGVIQVEIDGFEADDVIAVLSRIVEKQPMVIVSTDQDLLQLVTSEVVVYSPTKDSLITVKNFVEKVGVPLADFVDYKCLVGDSSDNISGVSGIGDKGAREVISTFGLALFLQQESVSSKKLQRLFTEEGKQELSVAQKLIDLSHVPLSIETVLDNLQVGGYDSEEAKDLLIDYDMWSLLDNWEEFEEGFGKVKGG